MRGVAETNLDDGFDPISITADTIAVGVEVLVEALLPVLTTISFSAECARLPGLS